MEKEELKNMLINKDTEHGNAERFKYLDHTIEQYKIYITIFNSTSDRRNKSNEFFLGLNAGIIGILGYVETKSVPHSSLITLLVPIAGIGICYCWFRIINAFSRINRAKFKVIHEMEATLPLSLWKTEWNILSKGKDKSKYYPLSQIEKNIPMIFIVLYLIILIMSTF
jgi:hypothetical protein